MTFRRNKHDRRTRLGGILLGLIWGASALQGGNASAPKIEFIEPFQKDLVLIHFDTEPNATYDLQYSDSLNPSSQNWISLYVAPNLPFGNHYVIPDTRTKLRRFYRLRVTL